MSLDLCVSMRVSLGANDTELHCNHLLIKLNERNMPQ